VFKGDRRHHRSEPPSLRRGIEWSNRYIPHDWLLVDLDSRVARAIHGRRFRPGRYLYSGSDRPGRIAGRDGERLRTVGRGPCMRATSDAALKEDNSQRSQSSTIFPRAPPTRSTRRQHQLRRFNLFNRKSNDIEYIRVAPEQSIQPEPASGERHSLPSGRRAPCAAVVDAIEELVLLGDGTRSRC